MAKKEVTKAIILVGGWGTRLRPLTYTIPKPLVPFCNRPMLKYQIEKLVAAGVREVVLAVNYYSDIIVRECVEYEREFGIRIVYSKEDIPLGTGGPLALAREHLAGSSFFVINSDICCNADLRQMRDAYMGSESLVTIMTYPVDDPTKYGLVKVEGGRIVSFVEKPKTRGEEPGPWIINAGMYVFSDEVLQHIRLEETSLETAVFPALAAMGQLSSFPLEGYWMDIGQIKDYLEGQRMFLGNMPRAELYAHNAARCSVSTDGSEGMIEYTSPYMSMEDNVVIGHNVRIGKNVVLENCTVFDGVSIGENSVIINSVIGWDCVIGSNCYVEDTSALGKGVYIDNNLSIKSLRIKPMESVYCSNLEEFEINA